MNVVIDGVEYAPVTEAHPDIDKIIKGLVYEFWGDAVNTKSIPELMERIRVRVYDDEQGDPIELVIGNVVKQLKGE